MSLPIYFIVGPTCIGKSSFALKLAKKIDAHIINADSMQVYQNLKILTARPLEKDFNEITHHLYGHIDGSERYNVAKWCNEASNIIKDCMNKKINTIIVGGTGMYIEKLINGLIDIPPIPEEFKKKSEDLFLKEGAENFYNIVKKIDLKSVYKINPNDKNRLKRIWEVFKYTNIPMSTWVKKNTKKFLENPNYYIYLFLPDRKKNYEKVNIRFLNMINNGAIDEVKKLLSLHLDSSLPVMRAHGVPEISLFLNNKINKEECIDKSQQVTRNYVKRQHTWWNSNSLKIHQKISEFPGEISLKSIKID